MPVGVWKKPFRSSWQDPIPGLLTLGAKLQPAIWAKPSPQKCWQSLHVDEFCHSRLLRARISGLIGDRMTVAQTSAVNRPTRVRWAIMACVTMVTVLTYLDRLNLAIAGKYIQDELSLSTHTMGWVLSAFLLGYSLFQIPGGWAGDRYGPKNILTGAILLWSLFTALTGLAPDLILSRWVGVAGSLMRSEERRVGKECRSLCRAILSKKK